MKHLQHLFELYDQPHRYYHNFSHIVRMLYVLNKHTVEITPELYIAVLYHDAIYDPTRDDNEAQSALLYESHCIDMGDTPDEKIIQMILDTKEHISTLEESKLLIDADLWTLGSNIWTYEMYTKAIEKEYSHLSDAEKYIGRTTFLEKMLARENIFYTPDFQRFYTHAAKTNLELELQGLKRRTIK